MNILKQDFDLVAFTNEDIERLAESIGYWNEERTKTTPITLLTLVTDSEDL